MKKHCLPFCMIFKNTTWAIIFFIILVILWSEYALYYITLLQCTWPSISAEESDNFILPNIEFRSLKVLLFTDTHIGYRHFWLDKLRREWQMQRAFQTSLFLHNPDLVIHLGDKLDHGFFQPDKEFEEDYRRFYEIFDVKKADTIFKSVPGNHDIGFHHRFHPYTYARYLKAFSNHKGKLISPVTMWIKKGLIFVFINSMAFQNDSCDLCNYSQYYLHVISERLKCMRGELSLEDCNAHIYPSDIHVMEDSDPIQPGTYSRPILITHFPLYREDETVCESGLFDSMPDADRERPYQQNFDCLSKSASDQLLDALHPRLVFGGHVHYGCHRRHKIKGNSEGLFVDEWTVPSFSHRLVKGPGFALLHVSPSGQAVAQCLLPTELTIVVSYLVGISLCLFLSCRSRLRRRRLVVPQHRSD